MVLQSNQPGNGAAKALHVSTSSYKFRDRGQLISINFINNIQSIDIYKLCYVSVKDNLFEEQSATIYVPEFYELAKIIIWIHGTFQNFDDNFNDVGWKIFSPSNVNSPPKSMGFELAKKTNNIVIAPDNVGYGASQGNPQYLDTQTQRDSVVDSFVAFKFLCKTLNFFQLNKQDTKIFVVGYSLGGIFVPSIANEIIGKSNNAIDWSISKIICGAPVNGNSIVKNIYESKLTTLSSKILFFSLLILCSKKYIACQVLKHDIYRELLPLFSKVYSSSGILNTKLNAKITELILKGVIQLNGSSQILANSIFNIDKLPLICEEELHSLTNPFLDLTLLSKCPMYTVYTQGDTLCNLHIDNNTVVDIIGELDTEVNGTFPSQKIQTKLNKHINKFEQHSINDTYDGLNDIINNDTEKYIRIKVQSSLNHTEFHDSFLIFVKNVIVPF
jgi:hypothetical protein